MVQFLDAVNAYKQVDSKPLIPGGRGGDGVGRGDIVGESFANALRETAQDTITTLNAAEKQGLAAAAGQADMAQLVTSVSEADVTLQTVVAVRDKVIGAYQEILKMPI